MTQTSNNETPNDPQTPENEFESPDDLFSKLKKAAAEYLGESVGEDLTKAYAFAKKAHTGQKRKSGEEYITHPIAVAHIVTDLKLDRDSLIAALLHDTVEDTAVTFEDIEREFGTSVMNLVDGLTKISRVKFRSSQEKLAENFRKMIVAMAKDLRVILIKLADRLHNMRTIQHMAIQKSKKIAQETVEIYAPLANRLGIYGIKSELEDLCLRQLRRDVYDDIRKKIAVKKNERQEYIDDVIDILRHELTKFNFKEFEVYGRPKHFYSIYKKMLDRRVEFEDIHDLFAFRVVVNDIRDCYEVLGIVHAMWKPMPGRFKDYIAMPKANFYQSLHTTVIRPNGEPAEIQIRTREMAQICEYGVAAHWAYKEGSGPELNEKDLEKFSWLRQIVHWQNELNDPDEFLEAVKVDLFEEEIFVFTPKGDVFSLGKGATTLDFAFAVHTQVGITTVGSKVNGRIAPLKKELKNGDIVEILTSKNQTPNKDWLNFAKTSKARNKIRSTLRKEQRDESRRVGQEILETELSRDGLSIESLEKKQKESLIKYAKESSLEDVYVAIGYGKFRARDLIQKLPVSKNATDARDDSITDTENIIQAPPPASRRIRKGSSSGIIVSGIDNVMVHFAKCCSPLPGEAIIGFITRGRGVTIHAAACRRSFDLDPARRIEAQWEENAQKVDRISKLRVFCRNKMGVLAEVTQVMSQLGVSVSKADIRLDRQHVGVLDFEVHLKDLNHLNDLIGKIESTPSVISVERRGSHNS